MERSKMSKVGQQRRATNKKPSYPISDELREYLARFNRDKELPVRYSQLLHWEEAMPLYDKDGNDTLWLTVVYNPEKMKQFSEGLKKIYAMLKTAGDLTFMDHLYVDRIDFCTFGNSNPFRIRIVNSLNENQDYYYIKKADASRIFGLELEHLLSPNRIHYFTYHNTLAEEHIVGIPGDMFVDKWLNSKRLKPVRIAKELVKFNERCFIRLLGDMRSYNFIVDITPDFEDIQLTIRPMDFDQQSFNGRLNFYRPQFFKENNELVFFCTKHLNLATSLQYQREEQSHIFRRMQLVRIRLETLLTSMRATELSTPEKVKQLRTSLAEYYKHSPFQACESMGELVSVNLHRLAHSLRGASQPIYNEFSAPSEDQLE
ncbi:MAG: hypothetical protein O7C75_19725 [Verrucomicrobia bacterium]|nr:hypothetical protein [Verrucomicrobiota bacterium]